MAAEDFREVLWVLLRVYQLRSEVNRPALCKVRIMPATPIVWPKYLPTCFQGSGILGVREGLLLHDSLTLTAHLLLSAISGFQPDACLIWARVEGSGALSDALHLAKAPAHLVRGISAGGVWMHAIQVAWTRVLDTPHHTSKPNGRPYGLQLRHRHTPVLVGAASSCTQAELQQAKTSCTMKELDVMSKRCDRRQHFSML